MKIRIKNEKKALIIAFVFVFTVLYGYWYFIFTPFFTKISFSNQVNAFASANNEPIFKIKEIMLYSSAYGEDHSKGQILRDIDVDQFTDIAITIDNKSYVKDLSNKNTVSELYIDNIKIEKNPNVGEAALNYKNTLTYRIYNKDITPTNRIDFKILHTNADNENNDFSSPTFFTDCSNPITLGYLNKKVKSNAEILKSDEKIEFNGKLLKATGVKIEDIAYRLSFQIHIRNSLQESYVYTVDLNVPLEDSDSSIYDGYLFKMMHNQSKSYYFLKESL